MWGVTGRLSPLIVGRRYGRVPRSQSGSFLQTICAGLWAPEKLAEIKRTRPGETLLRGDDLVRKRYIVEVRRITRNATDELGDLTGRAVHNWTAEIEHAGQIWRLPGPVLERIIQYRDRIITEARAEVGRNAAASRER